MRSLAVSGFLFLCLRMGALDKSANFEQLEDCCDRVYCEGLPCLPIYILSNWTRMIMMNLTMEHEHRVLGWRSGESTRLPPLWPGFDSLTCRHKWVELLLVLVPAPRVFLLVLRSTSLHKNQHSKFQFDLRFHHVMIKCALQISSIYLFNLFYLWLYSKAKSGEQREITPIYTLPV